MTHNKDLITISGKLGSGKSTVTSIIQYYLKYWRPDEHTETFRQTVEQLLVENKQLSVPTYKEYMWADTIKDIVCMLLECSRTDLEDPEFKSKELPPEWWVWEVNPHALFYLRRPVLYPYLELEESELPNRRYYRLIKLTPRMLLQLLGTDCGRKLIHPNIWVNALMKRVEGQKAIITDSRFENEVRAVQQRGGLVIRIDRSFRHRVCSQVRKDLNPNDWQSNYDFRQWLTINDPETLKALEHESETALDHFEFENIIVNSGSLIDLITQVESILKTNGYI